MRKAKINGLGKLVLAGMALAGLARNASSDAIIRTVPEQDVMVADGVTEYRMDVVGNTTGEPTKEIRYAIWQVYIPDKVTFTRAELPDPVNNPSQNPEDFFFNWLMDPPYNYVDNTPEPSGYSGWSKILKQNERARAPPYDGGPSNVDDKVLGKYWFTVNLGESGDANFLIGAPKFTATDGTQYTPSNGLQVDNRTFNIVAPSWADRTGPNGKRDGRVNSYDVAEFRACSSGSMVPYSTGCDWADRDGDGDVDQSDFGVFQRCYSGDSVVSNAECF